MFSYRSTLVLCASQLVALAAHGQAAASPGADVGTSTAPADEPPPLQGGPPPASAPASDAPPSAVPTPSSAVPPSEPVQTEFPAAPAPALAASSMPDQDNDAVFRAFAVLAAAERDKRIVGAVAGAVAGVTTIVLGATIAEPTGTDADVWYVFGGVTAGLSLIGLLLPSPAEGLARSYRVGETGHSAGEARALEIRWNDYALAAKRRRITGGAVSLVVSAVAIGSGIAISTGAGDFTADDQYFWGALLIGIGATAAVGGVTNLFVKTPAERSLEAYRAVRPEPIALAPLLVAGPAGAMVGARGTF